MLTVITSLFTGLIQLLMAFLPLSPFKDYLAQLPEWMDTGLGWLNWLIPIDDCLAFFLVWLTALAIYTVISLIIDFAKNFGDKAVK